MINYLKFVLMQYNWGRKLLKGKFYKVFPWMLSMPSFWSDQLITSCNTKLLKVEYHPIKE
jgi:hypothetical protein